MEICFLQMPLQNGLSKIKLHWDMIFLVLSGKMVFIFQKIYYFCGWKMKDDFSQEVHGNMIFSVYLYKCYKYDITLVQQKNQRWSSPKKIHLKGDWHSRSHRVPMILCTFMETFIGVFIYFLRYRIEIWLLLQIIWLEIFCNEESSILCTIQPSWVVFKGVLERQSRKVFVHYEMGYKSKNITMAVKCFYCRSAPNLSKGECQKTCESNHNWGNYGQKETTYFQEAFPQVPPLK